MTLLTLTSIQSIGFDLKFESTVLHKTCNIWLHGNETNPEEIQIFLDKKYNVHFFENNYLMPKNDLYLKISDRECIEYLSPSVNRLKCYYYLYLQENTNYPSVGFNGEKTGILANVRVKVDSNIGRKYYLRLLINKLPKCETYN